VTAFCFEDKPIVQGQPVVQTAQVFLWWSLFCRKTHHLVKAFVICCDSRRFYRPHLMAVCSAANNNPFSWSRLIIPTLLPSVFLTFLRLSTYKKLRRRRIEFLKPALYATLNLFV
jgi:hypothetical protein